MTRKRRIVFTICTTTLLVLAIGSSWYFFRPPRFLTETVNSTGMRTTLIGLAIDKYYQAYGELPGDSEQQISEALRGNNPKGKQFLVDRCFNDANVLVDYYDTPVQIEVGAGTIIVRSAGRNRIHGDEDDFVAEVPLEDRTQK